MSFEERNTLIYLFVSFVIAATFGSRIYDGTVAGLYAGADGLVAWARTILWMIPAGVGITIVSVILGQILYGILTGDGDLDTSSDERDKHIALQANRVTMVIFSLGWIGAIVLLAMGRTPLASLNLMLASGWFSDVAGNLSKWWLYRRGGWA